MKHLSFSADAFSHSQVKSKLWLAEHFNIWFRKYMLPQHSYRLNWYGSWVGLGPFIFLTNVEAKISIIHLYDLESNHLEISKSILNYWSCEGIHVMCHPEDINQVTPSTEPNQFFINTSCEHISSNEWLNKIPNDAFVILQSTDMPHPEHCNPSSDLEAFVHRYSDFLNVLETDEISFDYPDKSFKRFMLLGTRK